MPYVVNTNYGPGSPNLPMPELSFPGAQPNPFAGIGVNPMNPFADIGVNPMNPSGGMRNTTGIPVPFNPNSGMRNIASPKRTRSQPRINKSRAPGSGLSNIAPDRGINQVPPVMQNILPDLGLNQITGDIANKQVAYDPFNSLNPNDPIMNVLQAYFKNINGGGFMAPGTPGSQFTNITPDRNINQTSGRFQNPYVNPLRGLLFNRMFSPMG